MIEKKNYQIAKLSVIAKVEFLPAVTQFVKQAATKAGLDERDAGRLEIVVEEACVNVIEYSFPNNKSGTYDVIIERLPGKILVAVEDKGTPVDYTKFDDVSDSGLGVFLMKKIADELYFKNTAEGGKRVELVKNLPYKEAEELKLPEEKLKPEEMVLAPLTEKVTVDFMVPDQSRELAKFVYKVYGNNFSHESIYFPDKRIEEIESGLLDACVILNERSEIVGHLAMSLSAVDSMVGQSCQAIVDPRYIKHGLFKKMKEFMIDNANARGMYGLYSEVPADNIINQQSNISLNTHEIGVLMGDIISNFSRSKNNENVKNIRTASILFYIKINEEPALNVYPPYHHKTIISKIYNKHKLNRTIRTTSRTNIDRALVDKTAVRVKVLPETSTAYLSITDYGLDFKQHIMFRIKEFVHRKIECIYLDLPLNNPYTQLLCASFEMLGFFFAGVIPEYYETGDVLRLQYLNNVELANKKLQTASEFGQELLDYVLKAKQR
ncbi:MAG: ATP-binding protein [Bacteroidetes bacterium]|nr:ATP-binding protein [Bacteroidota bacterium]